MPLIRHSRICARPVMMSRAFGVGFVLAPSKMKLPITLFDKVQSLTSIVVMHMCFTPQPPHSAVFCICALLLVSAPHPAGFSVFLAHVVLLPIDGCSINPTRSFGPAVSLGLWPAQGRPRGSSLRFSFTVLLAYTVVLAAWPWCGSTSATSSLRSVGCKIPFPSRHSNVAHL